MIYKFLGVTLLSGGIILSCYLSSRVVAKMLENQLVRTSDYLMIAGMPVFQIPPATPALPLPTPLPAAVPLPSPPVRLSIPAIDLNTTVQEVYPITETLENGEQQWVWAVADDAAGHYYSSGSPDQSNNIVLTGHNNIKGAVFRRLADLEVGDTVIVSTAEADFHYRVQEKVIVPYFGREATAETELNRYTASTSAERVTLLSCWPYVTSLDRIVVIAVPAGGG